MEYESNFDAELDYFVRNQLKLYDAFMNQDIIEFNDAILNGANPFKKFPQQDMCVFDKALQTSEPSIFVMECVRHSNKTIFNLKDFWIKVINFACDTGDFDTLEIATICGKKNRNKLTDLTPFNFLVSKLNNANALNVKECIRVMLNCHNSNIPDSRGMTPLHNVIINNTLKDEHKTEIIEMFLSQDDIDIDTFREGELRKILETKYPDITLPSRVTLFSSLKTCLKAGKIHLFAKLYKQNTYNTFKTHKDLLMLSIELKAHIAFDLILHKIEDFDTTALSILIKSVLEVGNYIALGKLLKVPHIELDSSTFHEIVAFAAVFFKSPPREYYNCLILLFNSDKIDINGTNDQNFTALQMAFKYNRADLVKLLLKEGAYINLESNEYKLPLTDWNASMLEKHLDDCITDHTPLMCMINDRNYKITISFKNFKTSRRDKKLYKVVPSLEVMAKSKELSYLLHRKNYF